MSCNKTRTSYVVVVKQFVLVEDHPDGGQYQTWSPVYRDVSWEGGEPKQEWASFLRKELAEAFVVNLKERGWDFEYSVQEVISR